jgi:diguanylate cyclase (GGDEF)-like protein
LRRATDISLTTPGLDLATRMRVFQRALRSRVEHRDALLEILREMNASLEPTRVAELIVDRAASWIPAPSWAVVAAESGAQLSVLAERALPEALSRAAHAVTTWMMDHGTEFIAADLQRDSRIGDLEAASVVAFPLVSRGHAIGAVVGLDPIASAREPRLSPALLRGIRVLLEPAAVALDNAVQFRRTEALSVTDDLTSLYNSRYMNQVLRRETKRAQRSARPLSLLFIDLDGFKGINDTYGHLFGSRALVEAAAVIRGSARETDVVARFGGDEFSLILPDTGGEGAFAVGERIRERLAAHLFLVPDGLAVRLTASVGVATLPDAANSADELVQAADMAMYRVKARGKNGIEAAGEPADK